MRSSKLKDRRRRKPTLHRRDRINILLDVLLSSIADYYVYIDTDEIPGFVLLLKNHIFTARSEDTIFIFHVWGYWCGHGYQHNYPITIELLAQARGRFLIWNFIHKMASKCEDSTIFLFFIRILTFSNRKCKYSFSVPILGFLSFKENKSTNYDAIRVDESEASMSNENSERVRLWQWRRYSS